MNDAWYEPEAEPECSDGCVLEDPHDAPEACMSADDFRDERVLARWEADRDEGRA